MAGEQGERRLAAILAADVAGYSRLMGEDEAGTLGALKGHLQQFVTPQITQHRGRVVKLMGDGLLVEFSSVVDAVACAVVLQSGMLSRNEGMPAERRIVFRIGINVGDIIAEGGDIFGNGVNIAARIEGQAEPGGICVSRTAYEQVRGKLDLSFEDLGPRQLKNITEPVHLYRIAAGGPAVQATADNPPLVEDRPSIAVLAFANQSGDASLELLAECLAEDVITLLARVPGFFVIARSSSFAYKRGPVDVRAVGSELGVRYVVEGGVRAAGEMVRVSTQLTEAETGKHLWAGRFEVKRGDALDLQDAIARSVMVELEPELTRAELVLIKRQRTAILGAWSSYRQALGGIALKGLSEETVAQGIDHLRKAVEIDPEFALAHGMLALLIAIGFVTGFIDGHDELRAVALDAAERAIDLDGASSEVLGYAGCAISDLGARARGVELLERAIESDPSNAQARVALGAAQVLNRQIEIGIDNMRDGMRLSPRDMRLGFWGAFYANSLASAGRLDEALEAARTACRRDGKLYSARLSAAIILLRLNRMDEARAALAEAMRLRPQLSLLQIERQYGRRVAAELTPIWEMLPVYRN